MSDENRALSDIVWTPERGLSEPEIRGISWNNFLLSDENYRGRWRTEAEVRVTPETALQSTVVLACCRILAETISSLPLHVYRRGESGAKEIARDIPLYKVLSFAPNSWQTKFEFFEQMVMTLCLWGNSYTQIKSGRYGAVSELLNLHPSRMEVERLENGRLRYMYTNPETGRIEPYTQDQIMHVRWTPEPDGIKGMVPVEVAREAIALARACEIHASKYWANSARPGVVLQTDGTLSAEAAERLRENWERLHRGVDRAYKTAILTGGLKAEPIGFTAEQSQYVDSRRYQCEEVARVYRLPLRLVQGQSGGNPEVEGQDFVTYTLVPWLRRIESAISRSLIYNDDLFVAEFDVRGLMRGDSGSRAAYYSTMTNLGIFSINDCRRLENMPPLENGDKHFVGMNMQTLEDAVKPKPDPMAAMMGGAAAPPPAQGGVPSLPEVKTGKAPNEAEQGEKSIPKEEGLLVSYGNGQTGRIKHVMEEGTLDLKSGEKIEVKPGEPVALVVDETTGEEAGIPVSKLKPVQEKRALSPQNQALYDAQEEIVKANGRWPQQGPAGAHYMEKNPFSSRGIACRNCIYFEEGGSCEIVKGQIAPNAICKLWIIPEEKLHMPESRDCGTGSGGFKEGNKCAGGSDGEPVRGFRRGEGDKKQTRVARKLYQMGSSERQIKELVSQLGGKPGRSSAKVTGDKIAISVRDSSGKDKFYVEIGYNGAGIVPVGRKLTSDEAKEIESFAKQALPEKISGRLYNRGKEYPISVHRDDTALNRGRRIAPKGKQERAFCATGEGGGVDNSCGSKEKMAPDGDIASGGSSPSSPNPSPAPRNASSVTREDVARLLEKMSSNPDGFSLDPLSAEQPPTGIMVSEFLNDSERSVKISSAELSTDSGAEKFAEWLDKNADLLLGDDTRFVGGWKAGDEFYIDVSTRFEPNQAQEALEAGRNAGQLAVFNLETFKETWVKYDDGDARKPSDYDAKFDEALSRNPDAVDELKRHGKNSIRSYTSGEGESQGEIHGRESRTVRNPSERKVESPRDVRGLSGVREEDGGSEGRGTVSRMVSGEAPGAVGSQARPPEGVRHRAAEALVRELRDAGEVDVPNVVCRPKAESRAVAEYDHDTDTIYVSDAFTDEVAASFRLAAARGWVSQPNPLLHELAHRHHALADAESYEASKSLVFSDAESRALAESVSRYATANGREFVAEVVAGLWAGKEYDDGVMRMLSTITNGNFSQ